MDVIGTDNRFLKHMFSRTEINPRKEKLLDFEKVVTKSKEKGPITLREAAAFNSISDNLISSRPNGDILFGDFNLPNLNKASLNANLNLSSPEAIFLENLAFLNLFQINTIFNSYDSILDLILSNSNSHFISLNKDAIVPEDNYHPPINVIISVTLSSAHTLHYLFPKKPMTGIRWSPLIMIISVREYFDTGNHHKQRLKKYRKITKKIFKYILYFVQNIKKTVQISKYSNTIWEFRFHGNVSLRIQVIIQKRFAKN
ncbi:hypothetical protein QTP88_009445 [Uroleucon formosanum]